MVIIEKFNYVHCNKFRKGKTKISLLYLLKVWHFLHTNYRNKHTAGNNNSNVPVCF